MAVSRIKAYFKCDIQKVWEVVTSLDNYSWRSDLCKIEIIGENQFIEHTKSGYITTFEIITNDPFKRWEFNMENASIKGHWIGIFRQVNEGTEIDFTEEATPKKAIMKPFIKPYLKLQQKKYIADLRKALI